MLLTPNLNPARKHGTMVTLNQSPVRKQADAGLKLDGATPHEPGSTPGTASRHLRDVGFLCWICFLFVFAVAVITESNTDRDVDFVYFYSVGHIASAYPPVRLYDFKLQSDTFDAVRPLRPLSGKRSGYYGASPYPPFIALLFEPFSRLPFLSAFHLWQLLSLSLVLAALSLLSATFLAGRKLVQSIVYALALSFYPLIGATLLNGQLVALGLFSFALALFLQKRQHPYSCGLALSLCFYKPTLLLLFVPFLVVRKQWRTLSGLLSGGLVLVVATALIMGPDAWKAWLAMLPLLQRLQPFLVSTMYVDVHAFSTLLFPHWSILRNVLLTLLLAPAAWFLLKAWRKARNTDLLWPLTLTATLIVNVYVPIYDVSLVIISIVASASALFPRFEGKFIRIVMLIIVLPWITQPVARVAHIQLLTLALLLLGVLQYLACLGPPLKNPLTSRIADVRKPDLQVGELFQET